MSKNTEYRFLVCVIGVVLLLAGCGKHAQMQAPPPPTVTVAPVEKKKITEWEDFTGRTEAVEAVDVRPRVSGHIQEVCFQSGQLVKKGDVLFIIDPRWYQAEYDHREADYEQAMARLENSQRNADRAAKLLAGKTISSETADSSAYQYQEDKAAVLSAKAAMESARLDLDYTQVRAPIDGRVSRALLTTGNYVSGLAGAATLLTTLVSVDPIYVYADVDETSYVHFNALAGERKAEGENKVPVELAVGDEDGYPHSGYIESFDNRVSSTTGTILLRAVFPNSDGKLVPGMFARIRVPTRHNQETLLVDETAVGTDQAQKFVLSIGENNTVVYRKVTLGPVVDGKRVVRDGVEEGEKIIVNGIQRARPGMPVTPEPAPAGPQTATR